MCQRGRLEDGDETGEVALNHVDWLCPEGFRNIT